MIKDIIFIFIFWFIICVICFAIILCFYIYDEIKVDKKKPRHFCKGKKIRS